jgi:hypothetical protein
LLCERTTDGQQEAEQDATEQPRAFRPGRKHNDKISDRNLF